MMVAFSAFNSGDNRQRALDAGCNEYFNKTTKINQLLSIVQRYMPAA